jgi:hypothetical protein
LRGARIAMSTTFRNTDSDAEPKAIQQPAEATVAANYSISSVLVIITGLATSLAWTGFLAWGAGKILDVW